MFCLAAVVSYALVFFDPPADQTGIREQSITCFLEKDVCDVAAHAANEAFWLDRSRHRARCERQPAKSQ